MKKLFSSFGHFVLPLTLQAGTASFEINDEAETLEEIVVNLVELVLALPSEARDIWDSCDVRCFDIGIQSGALPHSAQFSLSEKAIARLASIGGEVRITVYGAQATEVRPNL